MHYLIKSLKKIISQNSRRQVSLSLFPNHSVNWCTNTAPPPKKNTTPFYFAKPPISPNSGNRPSFLFLGNLPHILFFWVTPLLEFLVNSNNIKIFHL